MSACTCPASDTYRQLDRDGPIHGDEATRRREMAEIVAMTESLRQQRRARDIQNGIDPDAPEPTVEQISAETIALRAQNDQALAEMRGRWRTYD